MCGLVGVFGQLDAKLENVFADLLQLDVIRGPHSTGVAMLDTAGNTPIIIKDTVLPNDLLNRKDIKTAMKWQMRMLMGHNRFATQGAVNKKNAHPFKRGDITLMHNGTLHGVGQLPVDKKFGTDSETIAYSIAQKGVDETWKNLNGAATLTYWDKGDESLNFVSNGKRPFHFAYTEGQKSIVWASESWMLRGACKRRDIKLHDDQVYFLPDHSLWTFKWEDNDLVQSSRVLKEFKWVGQVFNNVTYGGRSNLNYGRGRAYEGYGGRGSYPSKDFPDKYVGATTIPDDIVEKHLKHTDMAHEIVTLAEFQREYQTCHFCADSLAPAHHYETAVLVDQYTAVCGECALIAQMNNIDVAQHILL